MKKVLTAILLVAMIASIASVAAFADYAPLTISAGEVKVEKGATQAIVPITIANTNDLGISSVTVTVKVAGAQITAIEQADLTAGNWVPSDLPAEEVTVMWADISKGTHEKSLTFANVTVAIPEGAEVDDVIEVEVIVSEDPDNYVSFDEVEGDTVGYGATAVNGSITITDIVTTEPPVTTQPPVTTDTAPAGDKKDDGKKAPQTGDVAIIVVAAMIVALGSAIVVKKVNVK